MIYSFLMMAFFISWGGWFFMPPAYGDLMMFVPGFIAVVLTVYKREKLKKLFHFGSLSNLILGALLPISAFILYLVVASITSAQTFGLPEGAINYNNGDVLKAWSRFLIFGIPYMLMINFCLWGRAWLEGVFVKKIQA